MYSDYGGGSLQKEGAVDTRRAAARIRAAVAWTCGLSHLGGDRRNGRLQ
jgi:hypothetical protein